MPRALNILMIHPTHPATKHISGVRAAAFADQLVRRGHRVVLLCAQAGIEEDRPAAEHDWARERWMAPVMISRPATEQAQDVRGGPFAKLVRKAITAWKMVTVGGRMGDWAEAVVEAGMSLKPHFNPDIVWTTFGRMESVLAARRLSARLGCPWVLDVKDNWESFVPAGLRRLMAWRTRGAAAITSNAMFTDRMTRKWQKREVDVIYSGVDEAFFDLREPPENPSSLVINIVGSLYFRDQLQELLAGIAIWHAELPAERRAAARVVYYGGDAALFREVAGIVLKGIGFESPGYVPIAQLAARCRTALCNSYVASAATFHHKLLELLAAGRPILACPGEDDEARGIAVALSDHFFEVENRRAVSDRLAAITARSDQGPDVAAALDLGTVGWAHRAAQLESVFEQVIGGRAVHGPGKGASA